MSKKQKSDRMVDIETYSHLPTAAIASIGGIKFDIKTKMMYDEFYVTIDPQSCKEAGLHFSKKTLDWWATQSPEVRKELRKNNIPLKEALEKFLDWFGESGNFCCWGMFDMGIITYALHRVGLEPSWNYWDSTECRTVANLLGADIDRNMAGQQHHNALTDAKTQAKFIIDIFGE